MYSLNALAYSDSDITFTNKLAQIQQDLKNETQSFDAYLTQYKNGQISKDQMLTITDAHILAVQNILPRYDQLQVPESFAHSLQLFRLSTETQIESDKTLREWIVTGNDTTSSKSDQLLQQSFQYEMDALQSYQNVISTLSQSTPVIPIGLHKGEWVKYKDVYYVPQVSQDMKELAKSLSTSSVSDKNLTNSKFFSSKIVIKDVLNDSYVYDGVVYDENGTIKNFNSDIVGNFEPNDHYMLVVPVNLKVGDTVKGMTLLHDGIVKNIFSKPMLGQNIDVFEIVENNKTSSENYTVESHTDSFYDKKTGILLQSSASVSTSGSTFGSNMVGYEIEAIDFSDAPSSDTHVVPEFPLSILTLIIATFSIILISRIRITR